MNTEGGATPFPILLVEDDQVDTLVVKRLFNKLNIANPLICANDGVEALEILAPENGGETLDQPCLILLDLNMPRMDGLEFLRRIRDHEQLKQNVVMVLSTSAREEDMTSAYRLNAAGYFLKDNVRQIIEMLHYYCRLNRLPGPGAG